MTEQQKSLVEPRTTDISNGSFGPAEIEQMNSGLPDDTIALYLPPGFDKRFVPVRAKQLRKWWEEDDKTRMHARFCLPLTMAAGFGYFIPSPATFTVEWDGDETHDAEITIIEIADHAMVDNHSAHGSFTVQCRFLPRTKRIGDYTYIRGVANQRRSRFHVLDAMIESWWTPSEFGVVCMVNGAGKFTVQMGEPLAQMSIVSVQQAKYGLAITDGVPPFWEEWTQRRDPSIYNGRNMDYLQGRLPDGRGVCPHFKLFPGSYVTDAETGSAVIEHVFEDGSNGSSGSTKSTSSHDQTQLAHGESYQLLQEQAEEALNRGELKQSKILYERAIDAAETAADADSQLLDFVYEAASKMEQRGEPDWAKSLLHKCLALNESRFKLEEYDAKIFGKLAWLFRALGKSDAAARYAEESVRVRRKLKSDDHSFARSLLDLGTTYDVLNRYEEAEKNELEAIAILAKLFPEEHEDRIWADNVLACLYSHMKRFDEAQKLYDSVHKRKVKVHGAESEVMSTFHEDLGFNEFLKENLDGALHEFTKALEIRVKLLGKDHLDVGEMHDRLAWIHTEKKDLKKTAEEFAECVRIRELHLSADNRKLLDSYTRMSEIYNQQGDKKNSEKYLKKAKR